MNVVSFGEILWDIEGAHQTPGGAPANVAFHARQLGADAHMISAVGDDPLGKALLDLLDQWQVDRSTVSVLPHRPTGTVRVTLDAGGSATYEIVQPVAWDEIPPPAKPVAADAFVFGTLAQRSPTSRETLSALLDQLPRTTLRVYDVNLRPTATDAELVKASAKRCDLLKLNDAEVPFVADALGLPHDQDRLISGLHKLGIRYVALTCGSSGSVVSDGRTISKLPAAPTKIADTVGAGDAFTAALVTQLLAGAAIGAAHAKASAVAAYVCSQRGATPTLPAELK